jgi:molybdate transport system substrate-binding protein
MGITMMVTITSISGGAPKPVFDILGPRFLVQYGHRLHALYDSMTGLAARVAAGEAFDVLVMPIPLLDAYVKDGIVRPEGRAALANVGLAVGVKSGTNLPDISTPERLRVALRSARAVVHAPPGATPSGTQSDRVIKELGLADELTGRVIHKVGLAGGLAAIASGEAIGIFPKSEIANAEGVSLAGVLPSSLQLTIHYGAGVTKANPAAEIAAGFIRFLIAPENKSVWTNAGFDPVDD